MRFQGKRVRSVTNGSALAVRGNCRFETLEARLLLSTVEFDANDQIPEAYSLGDMQQTRATSELIEDTTDVDMFSFSVTAGQRVNLANGNQHRNNH